MRAAAVVVAVLAPFVGTPGCDCATEVTLPPPTAECLQNADCPPLSSTGEGFCRDGACQVALPAEGEGEGPVGEGEGEEGEGDGGAGEGEGEVDVGFVIAPTTVTLPSAALGGSSTGEAQIVNTGAAALTFSALTSSNGAFVVVAPDVGDVLAADQAVALSVRFTPTTAGAANAVITVGAGNASRTLSVSSTGLQDIEDGALRFAAGPDDDGLALAACECKAPVSPANVDIAYAVLSAGAPTTTCRKPANIACGVGDDCAPCNLGPQGSARWRSGRTEQPRSGDVPWIVDEEVLHAGAGDDGDFLLTATIPENGDCTATVASIGAGTNEACCQFVDCQGGAFACYPYQEPISCSLDCPAFARSATSNDCLFRGPVLVRARVAIDDVERHFCATLAEGDVLEVARVRRSAGTFSIANLGNVDEVDPGAPCP